MPNMDDAIREAAENVRRLHCLDDKCGHSKLLPTLEPLLRTLVDLAQREVKPAARQEALEEACRAVCKGCELGAPTYVDEYEGKVGATFHLTQQLGYSTNYSCNALAIRFLSVEGGKEF